MRNRGITLVALVVTIVVLLILAGITINAILGQNSIFDLAREAADKTNQAVENEQRELENLIDYINDQGWGSSTGGTRTKLADLVGKPADTTKNIDAEDKNGKPITIPAGFKVLAHGEDEVVYNTDSTNHSPCVEDGIVIQDSVGNQFVWVPVNEEQYARMIDETNHRGKLYDFGSYNSSSQTWTAYDNPTLKTYSATGYREPDTVKSYTIGDTTYNGDDVASNFIAAGIYDEEDNITDETIESTFKALLQSEFNEMAASVKKYKGFYIGRYETGNLVATKNSTPVVQRGNTQIANVNWYYMYANSKLIAKNNDKVTSSMIWGCQWDRTLEWIVSTNGNNWSLVTDSSSWGNYEDSTGDAATNSGSVRSTGYNEAWKKNNIYDMAGNVNDRTLEANNTNFRISRGGYCYYPGSVNPASYRYNNDLPASTHSYDGSRSVLYVK